LRKWDPELAYKADIAGGSLKVYESRIIAGLLLRKLRPAEWRHIIEVENILQKNSVATAKRQASLIKSRLKTMTAELWSLVEDGTKPVATQAVFAAAVAHSALLRDFLTYDLRDKFRAGNLVLTRNHWRGYVAACLDRDPEMSDWAASTTDKLGDSVMQILVEVGLLSQGPAQTLQLVHYEADVMTYLKTNEHDSTLRAMQAFL
jgi:hypothetical protein